MVIWRYARRQGPELRLAARRVICEWEALMAAARDQAARVLRADAENAGDGERDGRSASAGRTASHPCGRGDKRRAEAPAAPPARSRRPQSRRLRRSGAPAAAAAPKSGKRKFVLIGFLALLALAAAAYAVYYVLVGRFYVSTDDAYVRANNTMLGARVAGHIAAILPGDNALVQQGRRHLPDRRRRLQDRGRRRAYQDRERRRRPSPASAARSPRTRARSSRRRPISPPPKPA